MDTKAANQVQTTTTTKFEKAISPKELSVLSGYSVEYIRQVCFRKINPLPCIDISNTPGRHYYRIRPSVFAAFQEEEERRER